MRSKVDEEIREKYIKYLQEKKSQGLVGIWVFGFGIAIWTLSGILAIIRGGLTTTWFVGLIIMIFLWFVFGFDEYKKAKRELFRYRIDKLSAQGDKHEN